MIIIINKKDFKDDKKKIVRARPNGIMFINGTEDDEINVIKDCSDPLHGLRAKKSLRDKSAKTLMSKGKYEANIKEYLNSEDMMIAFKGAIGRIFSPDRITGKTDRDWVVFIILENKEYNLFADKIKKTLAKKMKLDDPEDIIVTYDDIDIFRDFYVAKSKKKIDKIKDRIKDIEDDEYLPNRDKRERIEELKDTISDMKSGDISKKKLRQFFIANCKASKKLTKKADAFMQKYHKNSFIEDGWGRGIR